MSSSNNNGNTAKRVKRTICLNVGGTIYEVSKSLLNQYSNTMLARMVSETWNSVDDADDDRIETTNDPLFIDRNGERFQYVLDYMRDSPKIVPLPVTVSKDGVLNDLEYFGFENINPDSFSLTSSHAVYQNMLIQMNDLDTKNNSEHTKQATQFELEKKSAQLARYCFLRFKFSKELKLNMIQHCKEDFHRPIYRKYNDSEFLQQMKNFAVTFVKNRSPPVEQIVCFNKYLGEYGLKFLKTEGNIYNLVIVVEIVKEEMSKK